MSQVNPLIAARIVELRRQIAESTGQLHSTINLLRMGLESVAEKQTRPDFFSFLTSDEKSVVNENPQKLAEFLETQDGKDLRSIFVLSFVQFLNPEPEPVESSEPEEK